MYIAERLLMTKYGKYINFYIEPLEKLNGTSDKTEKYSPKIKRKQTENKDILFGEILSREINKSKQRT